MTQPEDNEEFLYPAEALDALDKADRELLDSLVTGVTAEARLTREFEDVAALFAIATAPLHKPHARCKTAIMNSVSRRMLVTKSFDFDRILPWAAAAMLAIAGLFMGLQVSRQNYELALLRERILGPGEIRTAFLKPTTSSFDEQAALAEISYCGRLKQGRLIARNLPDLPPDQTYQLWLLPPDGGQPVSGGVFRPQPGGKVLLDFRPSPSVTGLSGASITIERFGGVERSSNPAYLAGS